MLSKKNSMVTMVTDEFLENRIILQKSVATIGFIWFFWFQKCILLYIFAQVFLVMRSIRSHISLFRLGFIKVLYFILRLSISMTISLLNVWWLYNEMKQEKSILDLYFSYPTKFNTEEFFIVSENDIMQRTLKDI